MEPMGRVFEGSLRVGDEPFRPLSMRVGSSLEGTTVLGFGFRV